MLKNLWRNSKAHELPVAVQATLRSQFNLADEAIGQLHFFGQSSRFASRPVRLIRLVDVALCGGDTKTSLKYKSFDDGPYKNAVRFEGHIEKEGYVLLHDRRPKTSRPS